MKKFTSVLLLSVVALMGAQAQTVSFKDKDTFLPGIDGFPDFAATTVVAGGKTYVLPMVAVSGITIAPAVTAEAAVSTSTTAATISQSGFVPVGTPGTPVVLSAASLVETVEIVARKSLTVANTGNVYVGLTGAGNQRRVLTPGQSWVLSAPAGKKIQLSAIYIDAATAADAVMFTAVN